MSPTPSDTEARREIRNDLVSGALCLALSAGLATVHFGQSGRLHEATGREPGPALLPEILLLLLAIAGAGLLFRGLRGNRDAGTEPMDMRAALTSAAPPLLALLLLASLLPLRSVIGAGLAFALVGAGLAVLAGRGEKVSILRTAALGGAIAAGFQAVFSHALSVPL
ncbi:tripartite tricarboxylate transporter TctB family protein [Tropicimonas sediminicola]|uniref:Tripartite tricarboxylate transporter TctB family protein n=1 Tax=Tropicimonas sediminicola TaxID=1031541 RepID=A0A239CBL1_9RHOB|nr:tripartite tricarboxylate transporter TctB family protein [Tropicimonas sediminicola]SNS17490.1 Tripartite tricarboxylate transporter TctB family protein [Tropicimonas sediminicola]